MGVDTAAFIYLTEEHPVYLEAVHDLFAAVDAGAIKAVTSTVTLLEVLVHPFRRVDEELARRYHEILLNANSLSCEVVSPEIAEEAARLRAAYNIRTRMPSNSPRPFVRALAPFLQMTASCRRFPASTS
jgi:predicted nucleic acid-binding protein